MSSILKVPSNVSSTLAQGLQIPDSAYGQCVPYVFGHCRIAHKLIYWANLQATEQGGKKSGKGGLTVYTVNADMLLGYGPMEGIASIWQNQTWFYVNYSSQTFTGSGTNTVFNFTISNNTSTLVMIMGVVYQVSYSESYSDYANPWDTRSFSLSGTSEMPLYNSEFPFPNYGNIANSAVPYATYNATYGGDTITVTFPTAVTNPVVTVYYAENGGNDAPPNTSGNKKGSGGVPINNPGLTFERELGSGPSGNPEALIEFSGVGGANIPLGPTPELPGFNYEVKALFGTGIVGPVASYDASNPNGYLITSTSGDCNPADVIADLICSGNQVPSSTMVWQHGLSFSSFFERAPVGGNDPDAPYAWSRFGGILEDEPNLWGTSWGGSTNLGLNAVRNYCLAYGISISGYRDSQTSAADFLTEICKVANCAPVWDGTGLAFIPYCEVSNYGNGASYVPPTASGPLFRLTGDNFYVPQEDKSPIEVVEDRPGENYNSLQIGFKDATMQWNDNYIIISDSMDVSQQGQMPGPQESYDFITSSAVANSVGLIRLRRTLMVEGTSFKFNLPAYWETILTPMDLITVQDADSLAVETPVRITTIDISVDKDGKRKMECEAERFIYGASAPFLPSQVGVSLSSNGGHGGNNPPPSVNAPIFIETNPTLAPNGPELWICVSASGAFYGGCAIWLSVDGGSSYGSAPIGTVLGRQTMGAVYNANYPNHADPDTTDTLDVDLTESLGTLASFASQAQNEFASLCYLAGGGSVTLPTGQVLTIPYELVAYGTATLAATNKYALAPPIRRGIYGTPTAAHNIGSAFSYLNDGLVFKMPLTAAMIGATLYFKFTAFNNLGGDAQGLSTVSPYTFTPTGLVGWTYPSGSAGGGPTNIPVPTGSTPFFEAFYYNGMPPASFEILRVPMAVPITFPAGLTGSEAVCQTAPTGSVQLTIQKNGSAIGTINFAASATVATFTFASAVTFNAGDILTIVAPSSADSTFATPGGMLAGSR